MNILLFLTPKNDVAYLYDDFTLRQALEKMEFHRYSAIPVLDREGHYVGTITEGDLLWEIKNRCSLDMRQAEGIPLDQIPRRTCNEPVRVDTTMEMLIEKALNQNFVPVVDDRGCFIGLVKRKEIIRYCYERMQDCPAGFATRLEKEGPATQELSFRIATEEDIPLILYYIKQLADYEQLGQEVTATEEVLREYLFRQRRAEVLIGETEGQPVGYALFFHNLVSTWRICTSIPLTGGKAMDGCSSGIWRRLLWNGSVCGWNGPAWTGTRLPAGFTRHWGRAPWRAGPPTGWTAKPWPDWRNEKIKKRASV